MQRSGPSQASTLSTPPNPAGDLRTVGATLAVMTGALVAVFALLTAPTAAVSVGIGAVAGRLTARTGRRLRRARQRGQRHDAQRHLCVPYVGVCIEV